MSLEVAAGECLALAGPSGAGKTSILRVVAGPLRPEPGVVRCGGETWLDTGRGADLARTAGAAATSSRTTRSSRT